MTADQTEGSPIPEPNLDPEQIALALQIAAQAEKTLKDAKDSSITFSEPLPHGDKADYTFEYDEEKQTSSLTICTAQFTDQMEITYSDRDKFVSLNYYEQIFGILLQTTISKNQDGDWSVLGHDTNDSAGLTGLFSRAMHRLEFADQRLADKS